MPLILFCYKSLYLVAWFVPPPKHQTLGWIKNFVVVYWFVQAALVFHIAAYKTAAALVAAEILDLVRS